MRSLHCVLGVLLSFTVPAQSNIVVAQALPTYKFGGLRGTVVADECEKHLAGVSVFASWGGDGAPDPFPRVARISETETRADGTFELPPWEATLSVPITSVVPRLGFVAPGRDFRHTGGPHTFRLRVASGSATERAVKLKEHAMGLALFLTLLYGESTPRILTALDREWEGLPADVRGDISPSTRYDAFLKSMRYGYEQELLKQR